MYVLLCTLKPALKVLKCISKSEYSLRIVRSGRLAVARSVLPPTRSCPDTRDKFDPAVGLGRRFCSSRIGCQCERRHDLRPELLPAHGLGGRAARPLHLLPGSAARATVRVQDVGPIVTCQWRLLWLLAVPKALAAAAMQRLRRGPLATPSLATLPNACTQVTGRAFGSSSLSASPTPRTQSRRTPIT